MCCRLRELPPVPRLSSGGDGGGGPPGLKPHDVLARHRWTRHSSAHRRCRRRKRRKPRTASNTPTKKRADRRSFMCLPRLQQTYLHPCLHPCGDTSYRETVRQQAQAETNAAHHHGWGSLALSESWAWRSAGWRLTGRKRRVERLHQCRGHPVAGRPQRHHYR